MSADGALNVRTCGGAEEPLAGNYFVSTYPPFSCWSDTATAGYRRHLAEPPPADPPADLSDNPLGLYVHIPFCTDRCHYCYYLSHDDRSGDVDRYLDAVAVELQQYRELPRLAERAPSFVYFGGGTPSLLSTGRIGRFLSALQEALPFSAAREITFECAPRTVTRDKLEVLRGQGVSRISLGVQQMDDAVLRANGRVHLRSDVERAYQAIRDVGFDVVNLDLMVGLVAETDSTFGQSLERVLDLGPDSVTIYLLEIPMNTPLWRAIRAGTLDAEPAGWETKRRRLRSAWDRLSLAGYTQVTAYAAVRDPEAHRFVYQDEQYHGADLLGVGASAFSYLGGFHQQNRTGVDDYIRTTTGGDLPLGRAYRLSDEERMTREFVLQLKLGSVGVGAFAAKFGVDLRQHFAAPLAAAVRDGWIVADGDRIRVTAEGLLRVDRVLTSFYLPEHRGVRYS